MTKKEWANLRSGHKVESIGTKSKGKVIRFNSNDSQCLVSWNPKVETWNGRLCINIDLDK